MKQVLVVGLGNPGKVYAQTRHNAGWAFVDLIAKHRHLQFEDLSRVGCMIAEDDRVVLVKPQLFMNKSGDSLGQYLRFYKKKWTDFPVCIVAYDDLDIALGKWKFVQASGPKVHNGVNSVVQALGTDEFFHARVGVDNRNGDRSMRGDQYVLQPFSSAEKEVFEATIEELYAEFNNMLTG